MASPERPLINLRWRGRRAYYVTAPPQRRWIALGSNPAVIRRRYDALELERHAAPRTVDAMLAEYIAAPRAPLALGTLRNYRVYRGHLAGVFGPLEPDTITQADIVRYLRTCKRKTARGEIGLLSLAFVGWMDQGRLDSNPCFGVRVKLPASRRSRLLADAEIDAAIGRADERLAVAIEIAYATGLRIGHLCRLRWAELGAGTATDKVQGVRLAFTSTPAFEALLDRARALQRHVASLYVLCDRRGRPWKPGTLRRHWQAACAACTPPVADAHFHDLRAAGATALERAGGDPQRFLGHKQRGTTEVYLRDRRVASVVPLTRRKA